MVDDHVAEQRAVVLALGRLDQVAADEFFHFYTAMLGRRMFFEIVQRVSGYDGYGTANTPIRMAAQYRHTALAGLTD